MIDFGGVNIIKLFRILAEFAAESERTIAWLNQKEFEATATSSVVLKALITALLEAGRFEDLKNLIKFESYEIDFEGLEDSLKNAADNSQKQAFLDSLAEFIDYLASSKLGSLRLPLIRDRIRARKFLAGLNIKNFQDFLKPEHLSTLANHAHQIVRNYAHFSSSSRFEKELVELKMAGNDYQSAVESIEVDERTEAENELGLMLTSLASTELLRKDRKVELINLIEGLLDAKLHSSLFALARNFLKEDLFNTEFFKILKNISKFKIAFASPNLVDKEGFVSAAENFTHSLLSLLDDYASISQVISAFYLFFSERNQMQHKLFVNIDEVKAREVKLKHGLLDNLLRIDQQNVLVVSQYALFDPAFAVKVYKRLFVRGDAWAKHSFE